MTAVPHSFGNIEGLIAGFRAPHSVPLVDDPSVVWFDDEAALFRTDVKASIIQDVRLLSDVTLNLFSARPTLFLLNNNADAVHLSLLLDARNIVLSPYDGIVLAPGIAARGGFAEHMFGSALDWLSAHPVALLPTTLSAFASLSKADFSRACLRGAHDSIAAVQHFWRIVGGHGAMAQTVMPSSRMIRVGAGGAFDNITPTLLFVDPAEVGELHALRLPQSAAVVAPFALSNRTPIDEMLSDFVDARPEPFHVHDVVILGEQEEGTLGCLYGEYVV